MSVKQYLQKQYNVNNNTMKRLILLSILGLSGMCSPAFSDEVELWVAKTDNSQIGLNFSNLRSITFDLEGSSSLSQKAFLVANAKDGSAQRLDMSELAYLYFGESETNSIDSVEDEKDALSIAIRSGFLYVNSA